MNTQDGNSTSDSAANSDSGAKPQKRSRRLGFIALGAVVLVGALAYGG
jgi:hypothetical protein